MALENSPQPKRLARDLAKDLPSWVPVTSEWLLARKISYQLAYHYVKAGDLERLVPGVFVRPGAPLALGASLRLLAAERDLHHVGGKTALAWHRFEHNVSPRAQKLVLFRHKRKRLPQWFVKNFPTRAVGRELFHEPDDTPLHVGAHPGYPGVPVADPERAALEMPSGIPQYRDLEEAEHLMQGMASLRVDAIRRLLTACRSVKTVRLFLHFARRLELPYAGELAADQFPNGSKSRYVRKLPRGTLIIKP